LRVIRPDLIFKKSQPKWQKPLSTNRGDLKKPGVVIRSRLLALDHAGIFPPKQKIRKFVSYMPMKTRNVDGSAISWPSPSMAAVSAERVKGNFRSWFFCVPGEMAAQVGRPLMGELPAFRVWWNL
jgi:hypothetical protein